MIGYIYQIKNTQNQKIYIGKTIQKPQRRFKQHITNALRDDPRLKDIHLYAAIRKHGPELFLMEILEQASADTKEELNCLLNQKEKEWIQHYNATDPAIGYNLTLGGDGNQNMLPSTKIKIINTKRKNGTLQHSAITKQKIANAHRGKVLSPEHIQHLKDNHHQKKQHILFFQDEHVELSTESVKDLAKKLNTSAIKLRRASEVGEFRCGNFYLLDLTDLSKAFDHQYRYSKERCMIDPVFHDSVTPGTLRLRKRYHPELYPNFTSYQYDTNTQQIKQSFIQHFENIKNQILKS